MKALILFGACVLVALAAAAACSSGGQTKAAGGAGGSTHGGVPNGGTGNTDGSIGGANTGGTKACTVVGLPCAAASDCCSEQCDSKTKTCIVTPQSCKEGGADCTLGTDCCSFACLAGKCSVDQCTPDHAACTTDGQCCGGRCVAGTCQQLNGCRTSGNPCTDQSQCCSKYCVKGLCDANPSYCRVNGDVCAGDLDCCGGKCQKASGATLGICAQVPASGATGCLSAGEVCSGGLTVGVGGAGAGGSPGYNLPTCGGECCSRACFPYGPSGVLICQPPSGCHPTGEICQSNSDCCGGDGRPDGDQTHVTCSKSDNNVIGRCDNGNKCAPAGGICRLQTNSCNATDNCCAGNVQQHNTCKQDSLGIPRCLAAEIDCTDPSKFTGKACASSADCCNLPCVPNPGGTPPFICGSACVPAGGSCTTTADCCAGLPCVVPQGSAVGVCEKPTPTPDGGVGGAPSTCADYAQACKTNADCCNGVPCTTTEVGQYCLYPLR